MSKKIVTLGFIIMVLTTTPLTIAYAEHKQSILVPKGDIIYVGGTGPGNYTTITDALTNATANDTIYVYAGMYTEGTILINIPVTIIGESNTSTILNQTRLFMNTSNISFSSFRFQNSSGIAIYSLYNDTVTVGYNLVTNTIFDQNSSGIWIFNSSYNTITHNQFTHCGIAIWPNLYISGLFPQKQVFTNTITNNIVNQKPLVYLEDAADQSILDAGEIILVRCQNITMSQLSMNDGVSLIEYIDTSTSKLMNSDLHTTMILCTNADDNTLLYNRFTPYADGVQNGGIMFIYNCTNNSIEHNVFTPNYFIALEQSSHNTFSYNDFHRTFSLSPGPWSINSDNCWVHNYWFRPRILPKLLLGFSLDQHDSELYLSWDIDWRPALTPNNPIPNWIHTTHKDNLAQHQFWMFTYPGIPCENSFGPSEYVHALMKH